MCGGDLTRFFNMKQEWDEREKQDQREKDELEKPRRRGTIID